MTRYDTNDENLRPLFFSTKEKDEGPDFSNSKKFQTRFLARSLVLNHSCYVWYLSCDPM